MMWSDGNVTGLHQWGRGIWVWDIARAAGDPWSEPCSYMATTGKDQIKAVYIPIYNWQS